MRSRIKNNKNVFTSETDDLYHLTHTLWMEADYNVNTTNVNFKHKLALMSVIMDLPEYTIHDGNLKFFTVGNDLNNATLNISEYMWTPESTSFIAHLFVEEYEEKTRDLTFNLYTNTDTYFTYTIETSKKYEAGKRYTAYLQGNQALVKKQGLRLSSDINDFINAGNRWVVLDNTANTADNFMNLRNALNRSRNITIEFPFLSSIPDYALQTSYASYRGLSNIHLPSVQTIGAYAFNNNDLLESIDAPILISIGRNCFYRNTILQNINMPLIKIIGNQAFQNCIAIKSLEMINLEEIGEYGFENCSSLNQINAPNLLSIDEYAFSKTALKSINFPLLTSLSSSAFLYCQELTDANLSKLKTINISSFRECSKLQSVNCPLVEEIDANAFYNCVKLKNIHLLNVHTINMMSFYNTGLNEVLLPKITKLNDFVFSKCKSLVKVDAPLVTTIGGQVFDETALEEINIPLVTSIDYKAFYKCNELQSIEMPLVKSIGEYAFAECEKLISVDAPLVDVLGQNAFYRCILLKDINLTKLSILNQNSFAFTSISEINLPFVTRVNGYAFNNCQLLKSINLPIAEYIGSNAFYNCTSLQSILFPKAIEISYSAFQNCNNVKSIDLPEIKTIDTRAFMGMTNLTELKLGYKHLNIFGQRDIATDILYSSAVLNVNLLLNKNEYNAISQDDLSSNKWRGFGPFKSISYQ